MPTTTQIGGLASLKTGFAKGTGWSRATTCPPAVGSSFPDPDPARDERERADGEPGAAWRGAHPAA